MLSVDPSVCYVYILDPPTRTPSQSVKDSKGRDDFETAHMRNNILKLKKVIDLDEAEHQKIYQSSSRYLHQAISSYTSVLENGSSHDLHAVFRMLRLWLRNSSDENVNRLILDAIGKVPSHKFVSLAYQVASRLGPSIDSEPKFQQAIRTFILKLALEHPHHTLYHIYALKNGARTERGTELKTNMPMPGGLERTVDFGKVQAAADLLNLIRHGTLSREGDEHSQVSTVCFG